MAMSKLKSDKKQASERLGSLSSPHPIYNTYGKQPSQYTEMREKSERLPFAPKRSSDSVADLGILRSRLK